MSGQQPDRPGFHAIMMASAYAEEGLGEQARGILQEDARERPELGLQRPASASRARRAFSAAAG